MNCPANSLSDQERQSAEPEAPGCVDRLQEHVASHVARQEDDTHPHVDMNWDYDLQVSEIVYNGVGFYPGDAHTDFHEYD